MNHVQSLTNKSSRTRSPRKISYVMKSFFSTLALVLSLVIIPQYSFAQQNPTQGSSIFISRFDWDGTDPRPGQPPSQPEASINTFVNNFDTPNPYSTYTIEVYNTLGALLKSGGGTVASGGVIGGGNNISVGNLPYKADLKVKYKLFYTTGSFDTYSYDIQFGFKPKTFYVTSNAGGGGQQQTGNECSIIDDFNYQNCCLESIDNAIACKKYTDAGGMGPGGAGTIGSGEPNTNPQNSGTTPPVISPTPQASSAALSSCNAIKFDSLLDILIWLRCVIAAAIIPLIFTLAFLFFLWGMVMYIRGSDDVKKREESKKFIYWGIIGLTVMVSIWGIVKIVNTTFGFGNAVPTLQTKDNCLTTDPNNPCKK